MKKTLSSVLTFLMFWGWFLGPSCAEARNKITIGYASMSTVVTTLWVARDEGFLAKNNIDAELVFVPGSPVLLGALNSGDIQIGYGGGPASLGAAARGLDVKVLAAFSNRSGNDFVVRPEIKRPQDLRGKRIGVTAIGGTGWMGAVLVLERMGLNAEKDHIQISSFGDQRVISQALETGTIDAALVTAVFTHRLKGLGYRILGELDRIPLMADHSGAKHVQVNVNQTAMKVLVPSCLFTC